MSTKTQGYAYGVCKGLINYLMAYLTILGIGIFFPDSHVCAQTQNFTTTGSHQWTCPIGVNVVTVECWGGGGAGGGATGNSNSAGGGGAGGAYVKRVDYPVTPGVTYNLYVGAGGAGSTNNGDEGDASWFGSSSTILAVGGNGGSRSSSSNNGAAGAAAKNSGNLGFTAGFSFYGGKGANGSSSSYGGGGGSSAGTGADGNGATNRNGASAVAGGGAGGSGATSGNASDNNNLGGGGGAARATSSTNRSGGDGGDGKVTLSYTQLTFKSQIISVDAGASSWCAGESRNVTVQIKNNGTATWTDASPDINIGIKWNTNGGSWNDYFVRVDAGDLAPGDTRSYLIPVTASNNNGSYTTPLSPGTNNLTVDVVYEGLGWFASNADGLGPGNAVFTTPNQTISAVPSISHSAILEACFGNTSALMNYTDAVGSPDTYSIDFDALAEAAGFTDISDATLPVSPVTISLPGSLPAGDYNGTLTLSNTAGCVSSPSSLVIRINATPSITLGQDPTICHGVASALISYTANNADGYEIDFDGSAEAAGFSDVSNGVLGGGNVSIVVPEGAPSGVYHGSLVPKDNSSGCEGSPVAFTITIQGPVVSITGASTICEGNTTTLSPTSGGVWASNAPSVASVAVDGTVTGLSGGTVSFSFTDDVTGCTVTTDDVTVNANSSISLTSAPSTTSQTVCVNTAVVNITYSLGGGATGASTTGLPAGVTGSYDVNSHVYTISGSPSEAGDFNYTVTTTGPCVNDDLSGLIHVVDDASITLTSNASTTSQSLCMGSSIDEITYQIGGSGTGGSVSGLPSGVSFNFDNGVITISGSPTVSGVFNYTVTTVGPCATPSAAGTITVTDAPTNLSVSPSSATICAGSSETLTGNASIVAPTTVASENFNGTPNVTTSGSATNNGQAWENENDGVSVNNIQAFNSPNGGGIEVAMSAISLCFSFSGCPASANTTMNMASFSTVNMNNATISWAQAYKQGLAGSSGVVEISTDGVTWNTLKTYTSNQGAANAFVVVNVSLDPSYLNQSSVMVRFVFNSNVSASFFGSASSWWAVDDFAVNGNAAPLYSWSADTAPEVNGLPNGSETPSASNSSVLVSPTQTSNYTLNVQNPVTGCSSSLTDVLVTVNQNATIALSSGIGSDAQSICSGSDITPITYQIGGGGNGALISGLPGSFQGSYADGTFTITGGTNAAPGTYNYTVTTTGNCEQVSANGSVIVTEPLSLPVTIRNVSVCSETPDGSLSVAPEGGTAPYTYLWTGIIGSGNPANTPYTGVNDEATISGLQYGFYNLTVTDALGCSSSVTGIHVKKAFLPVISHNGSISAECTPTGSLIIYAAAGVAPYTYSLDGVNYQASNLFTGLPGGPVTIYAKDAGGCIGTKSYTIGQALPVTIDTYVIPTSSCSNDGQIIVYRSGGIPPYTYSLDGLNYQVSNAFQNLETGNYTVHVKDSKGCDYTHETVVPQGTGISLTYHKSDVSACVNDGSFQLIASGGVAPYTYSIDGINFQESHTFDHLAAGTYTVTVKDLRGCTGSINITLNTTLISINPLIVSATDCEATDGRIEVYHSGGYGPFTYSLDGNNYQNESVFDNLAAGLYDIYVKDSKTCVGVNYNVLVGPDGCDYNFLTKKNVYTTPKSELIAYPNPSHHAFQLQIAQDNEGVVVEVRNVLGKLVYKSGKITQSKIELGEDWLPGVYFAKVITKKGTYSLKLVKN